MWGSWRGLRGQYVPEKPPISFAQPRRDIRVLETTDRYFLLSLLFEKYSDARFQE